MGIGRAGPDRPSRGVWVGGDERVAISSVLQIGWNYDKKDRQSDFNNHDGCRNTHGRADIVLSIVCARIAAVGGVTGVGTETAESSGGRCAKEGLHRPSRIRFTGQASASRNRACQRWATLCWGSSYLCGNVPRHRYWQRGTDRAESPDFIGRSERICNLRPLAPEWASSGMLRFTGFPSVGIGQFDQSYH